MHAYIHRCHYLRSQLIMQYYYSRYIFVPYKPVLVREVPVLLYYSITVT